jgi:hypothetical protein
MIQGLVLENFKAFSERQRIPFAPITLIYGTNSAGKSSIIQALLLLKQSVESNDVSRTLVTRGDLVDLGNFHDISFNHDRDRIVEITPILQRQSVNSSRSRRVIPHEFGNTFGVGIRFGYDPQTKALAVCELPVYSGTNKVPIFSVQPISPQIGDDAGELLSARAEIAHIEPDHPAWQALFKRFREAPLRNLQNSLNELNMLLSSKPDEKRPGPHDREYSMALIRWLRFHELEDDLSEQAPLRREGSAEPTLSTCNLFKSAVH